MSLNSTMFDHDALYIKATQVYAEAEYTISRMDTVFQNIAGISYDTEATLAEFDIILQGILLSVACADGLFEPIEKSFIENITVHGDLLEYLNCILPDDIEITWDDLTDLPPDMNDTLVSLLPQILEDKCSSFVTPLAAVDFSYARYGNERTTPGDFLTNIESALIKIASLLAFVDDEGTEEELLSAAGMIHALVDRHWKKYIET